MNNPYSCRHPNWIIHFDVARTIPLDNAHIFCYSCGISAQAARVFASPRTWFEVTDSP